MTEAEWLASNDPRAMLDFLAASYRHLSARKLRLFAVGCCRTMFLDVAGSSGNMHEIAVAELFADGEATAEELESARAYFRANSSDAECACMNTSENPASVGMADAASGNAAWATTGQKLRPPEGTLERVAFDTRLAGSESRHSALLRDIFGNPFRSVAFDPTWRTESAVGIASTIYDDRAFERLPILADALQEAGCENEDILTHCREPGEHVRGCWVVDLVLGKS